MLIWDTGEFEVLPYRKPPKEQTTDDELSDCNQDTNGAVTHSEKLFAGFQSRHLRLRLRGSKLPNNYTIGLRLPSSNDAGTQPRKPKHRRRRTEPCRTKNAIPSSDTDGEGASLKVDMDLAADDEDAAVASEVENEDDTIRENNAYTGATNSIGSIHQRHWFLTLDNTRSGFHKSRDGRWEEAWEPFFVLGRDVERSVVTGRTAEEVMTDEGVEKFVGRKMWRPITE